ncbi:hypothetical protein HN51_000420 [Arachis hypogaea]
MARTYLLFSLHFSLHPIRIYLRAQGITHSLTQAFLAGTLLHLPFNYIPFTHLRLGIASVVTSATASNPSILLSLVRRIWITSLYCRMWSPQ